MDSLVTDIRYGVRMLLRTPLLSAVAVLTIALGVGLTTHTFSVVYGSVIRGLDFDRGTKLIALAEDAMLHRMRLRYEAIAEGVTGRDVLRELLRTLGGGSSAHNGSAPA